MADESNGESTFEFVDKKADEFSVSGETTKTESLSSLSSSASFLTPLGISTSTGNLLSNVAPPTALPSFITSPTKPSVESNIISKDNNALNPCKNIDPVKSQPLPNVRNQTKQSHSMEENPPIASTSSSTIINQNVESGSLLENPLHETGVTGGGLFSWVKETMANSHVLSKVAEKAKNSVNSMITTLDPQMRDFIYSGGDVEIVVASNKDVKVSPVREAFQSVFGKATVTGVSVNTTAVAEQPVGFAAGVKGAEERIHSVRNNSALPKDIPIVAVENFLLEVGEDKWYDLGVILLNDPRHNVTLQTFTQMTPVPSQIVALAQESTPKDYPLSWSGLSITIGSLMATNLQVSHNEWHHALTGVSRRNIIFLAAQSLAGIYKNTINPV
ncbi:protein PRRC1 [Orussus abietinus]|uniref:protein PRRC1 n=1 Tax=Orussus abietinus TaxID=222816 RepID=UPI0006265367|nr:protein PRRC1 [Orussus abietinus]